MSIRRIWACCGILLVLLLAQRCAAYYIDQYHRDTKPVPLQRPLKEFPERLGEWRGTDLPVSEDILKIAEADDYLSRIYERSANGKLISIKVWANYSTGQGSLGHMPVTCMPGAGYKVVDNGQPIIEKRTEDGVDCKFSQLQFEKDHAQEWVYYWRYTLGAPDPLNKIGNRLARYAAAFLRVQNSSALVLSTYVPLEADPDGRLSEELIALIVRELRESYLPPGSEIHAEMPLR